MGQLAELTPREMQISEYVAWGAAKKEIADELHIAETTVAATLRNVFRKLNIQKSTELSRIYFTRTYKISLEDCPFKRALIAFMFVGLLVATEVLLAIRPPRTRCRTECRTRRARRVDDDVFQFNLA